MGDFGNKFRKAREKKELSLDDVSNVTKISSRMLQAIEEERFDLLPGGVFNKGFIRAYAKHLGLNDEEAVTDYLASLRQAQIDAHEVWQPERSAAPRVASPSQRRAATESQPAPPKPPAPVVVEELPDLHLPRAEDIRPPQKEFSGKSSSEIPWTIIAIASVVLVLGLFLWSHHSRAPQTAKAGEPVAKPAVVPSALAAPIPTPVPATQPPPAKSATAQPAQKPPATTTRPAALTAPTSAADTQERVVTKNDVTIRSFGKTTTKPSEKVAGSLALVIRATENSWISVLADGQLVTQETLIAPANTSVHASNQIVVKIGNAAGVTFLWNGQETPAEGSEGEVKSFTFDAGGMHQSPAE
jgi:cytoskeletal protein RodZ